MARDAAGTLDVDTLQIAAAHSDVRSAFVQMPDRNLLNEDDLLVARSHPPKQQQRG